MSREQTDAGAAEPSTRVGKPIDHPAAPREDEFSYRQLFDNMAEGFALHEIIADATGKVIDFRFLAANPAFDRHTGLQGRAIIGKSLLEVMPGADRHQIEAYGRVALTGEPLSFEYHSDTFGRHVRVRAYSPSPGRFATIFEDITERKLAEEKLAKSEALYRLLAENASDAVFMVDAGGKEAYISPSFARLLGYAESDLVYLNPAARLDTIHPDDRAAVVAKFKRAKELCLPHSSVQYRMKNSLGDYVWIEVNLRREFDSAGQFVREIGIVRDISERKRLEQELRGREERLRLVIENSPDVIWIWDQDGNMQFVSGALEPTYGVSPQAMLAAAALTHARAARLPAHELTVDCLVELGAPNLAFAGIWLKMQSAVKTCVQHLGEKVHHETRLEMPDDQVRYMHTTYQAFRRGPAEVEVVAITHDVTEIVQAREQVQGALQQLRVATEAVQNANVVLEQRVTERTAQLTTALREIAKASRLKDEFMAAVSHELRTPLTGVLGIAETMEMQITGPLNERQLRGVRSIRASGNRLLEIVNSILRYTAVAAGNVALRAEPCRLSDLVAAAAQWTQPQAEVRGQKIAVHIDPTDPIIVSDADTIRQVLQQLLDNAVKFTPHGGSIGLEVHGDDDRDRVRLVVWDTGIGIVQEQHTTIFQPFIQVEGGLARRYEGIGLGLAYVARVVDLLGGTVTVESTPAEGSRFTVTLPAQIRR